MTINGVDPKDFGAELKLEYTVGMPELDTQTLQGRNRTNFILTAQILGMREITLPFVITGIDHADIMYRKSYLDQLFIGKCELFLPDDFYYSAAVDTFEDVEFKGPHHSIFGTRCFSIRGTILFQKHSSPNSSMFAFWKICPEP